jgi:hypothetical protein
LNIPFTFGNSSERAVSLAEKNAAARYNVLRSLISLHNEHRVRMYIFIIIIIIIIILWGETESLGTATTAGLLYQPQMIVMVIVEKLGE